MLGVYIFLYVWCACAMSFLCKPAHANTGSNPYIFAANLQRIIWVADFCSPYYNGHARDHATQGAEWALPVRSWPGPSGSVYIHTHT